MKTFFNLEGRNAGVESILNGPNLSLEAKEDAAEKERAKIIAGLNAQTAAQFTSYAAQQHPGDPEAQQNLIQARFKKFHTFSSPTSG